MKFIPTTLLVAAALGSAGLAQAADELALAKAKNCMSCHGVEKKLVGPGYKEVAVKYKGDKSAAAALATKIKAGGKGAWGAIPMPPNNVSEAEAKRLAEWVLSL
ncbi:MAG: cytochrome C biogenesis protein CcsA [Betaproteobacteria bacterium HGW-Betaproteobacteria-12]|nr:MAG: cytochrome C biogenesis protein CcsA [Betaproteobacteria bacterium HGW-Betaproteobacteria-12]